MVVRTAVIPRGSRLSLSAGLVKRYLYANYDILAVTPDRIYIQGFDSAGFTLDAILDRLASGIIYGHELGSVPA